MSPGLLRGRATLTLNDHSDIRGLFVRIPLRVLDINYTIGVARTRSRLGNLRSSRRSKWSWAYFSGTACTSDHASRKVYSSRTEFVHLLEENRQGPIQSMT